MIRSKKGGLLRIPERISRLSRVVASTWLRSWEKKYKFFSEAKMKALASPKCLDNLHACSHPARRQHTARLHE